MNRDPVWITGVGALTPIGNTYHDIAQSLLTGRSGVKRVTAFDVCEHPSQIAAMIEAIPTTGSWGASKSAGLDRVDHATLWCCVGALRDAGCWPPPPGARIGIVLGNAAEWHTRWQNDFLGGGRQLAVAHEHEEALVHRTKRRLELTGPAASMSAACASGNYALALARTWLRLGWADVCLAGASDLTITPLTLAGFGNLRALSRRNDDAQGASRPFDSDRDGFVMGEGSTIFVLESADRARRRGARGYAEVAGCGASSDAHHMVIPSPDPEPAIAAMRQALADACINPDEVDYVNAHATGTPVGDQAEARVLHAVFGSHIESLPVSSTKSITGHLLTAAAAVEALACIIALDRQTLPPTINLNRPDPECRLRHVPNHAQDHRVRVTASNSFGFGGSNTCLILRAV
jgi:3-oxoacyl-[acyl-carrier-protein] synthase II